MEKIQNSKLINSNSIKAKHKKYIPFSLNAHILSPFKPKQQSNDNSNIDSEDDEFTQRDIDKIKKFQQQKKRRYALPSSSIKFGFTIEDLMNKELTNIGQYSQKNIEEQKQENFKQSCSNVLSEIEMLKGMLGSQKNQKLETINSDTQENLKTQDELKNFISLQDKIQKKTDEILAQKLSSKTLKQSQMLSNDEIQLDNLNPDQLKIFLLKSLVLSGINKKKKEMKQIFIIYKKLHSDFQTMKIIDFWIPIYLKIVDRAELKINFEDWIDYVYGILKLRNEGDIYLYLPFGQQVKTLDEIPKGVNYLIVSHDKDELKFWHEFQMHYQLHLSISKQQYYIKYLNQLTNKEEIYKSIISFRIIDQILNQQQEKQLINDTIEMSINQDYFNNYNMKKCCSLPQIITRQKNYSLNDQSQSNAINFTQQQNQSIQSYRIMTNNQSQNDLQNINSGKIKNTISSHQSQRIGNNNSKQQIVNQSQSIQISQTNEKNNQYSNSYDYDRVNGTSQSYASSERSKIYSNRQNELFRKYIQYQCAIKDMQTINKKFFFNTAAIKKQYNDVKMKIILQSIPIVANSLQIKKDSKNKKNKSNDQSLTEQILNEVINNSHESLEILNI